MYYNKSLVKAAEKAFVNLRRDLSEVAHLQISRNIRTFLNKAQEKFEKTIYFELQNLGINSSLVISHNEEKILPLKAGGKLDLVMIGLDNLAIFSHGLASLSFAIALLEGEEIVGMILANPAINSIIFDKFDELFILNNEGVSKKIKMLNSTNIAISTIIAGVDKDNFQLERFLPQRDLLPLSSSSLLYEISLLLQNKLDLVVYQAPKSEIFVKILESLIKKAGGSSCLIQEKIFCGKNSLIKSIQSKLESI